VGQSSFKYAASKDRNDLRKKNKGLHPKFFCFKNKFLKQKKSDRMNRGLTIILVL